MFCRDITRYKEMRDPGLLQLECLAENKKQSNDNIKSSLFLFYLQNFCPF